MKQFIYHLLIPRYPIGKKIISRVNIRNPVWKVQIHPDSIKQQHGKNKKTEKQSESFDFFSFDIAKISAVKQKHHDKKAHGINIGGSFDLS